MPWSVAALRCKFSVWSISHFWHVVSQPIFRWDTDNGVMELPLLLTIVNAWSRYPEFLQLEARCTVTEIVDSSQEETEAMMAQRMAASNAAALDYTGDSHTAVFSQSMKVKKQRSRP